MAKEKGLVPGFEATLDAHFEAMVSNKDFQVPGVCVLAKRGKCVTTQQPTTQRSLPLTR